jgi:hypothetical protein
MVPLELMRVVEESRWERRRGVAVINWLVEWLICLVDVWYD